MIGLHHVREALLVVFAESSLPTDNDRTYVATRTVPKH
jgi:hypothetical protein